MESSTVFVPGKLHERVSQKAAQENLHLQRNQRLLMTATLLLADLAGLVLAGLGAIYARVLIGGDFVPGGYLNLLPLLVIFLIPYLVAGLYPGVGLNFVDELRKLSLATSIMVAVMITYTFIAQSGIRFSRLTFFLFWAGALACVPLSRWLVRGFVIRTGNWGEPIAIIGHGEKTHKIIDYLQHNRQLGYLPTTIIRDFKNGSALSVEPLMDIPIHEIEKDHELLKKLHIHNAILVPTETPEDFLKALLEDRQFGLKKLILISSLQWIGGSAVTARDINGILGLELQRNLLNPIDRAIKFILTGILLYGTCWISIPVTALCALLVRLDSKGPIFYGQKRIGQDEKEIKVWKFRSMLPDADEVLERCLECDPELRKEWENTHKLKNDPRITRVGQILRKTSLDELPQLWNVLKGEMDLVGPRPIVKEEVIKYRNSFRLYTQVKPGMTGLWQISGRNDTTYDERVSLDDYYVRHWSPWMDIYILLRTAWVVILRQGAY